MSTAPQLSGEEAIIADTVAAPIDDRAAAFASVVAERRSARGFLPTPIPGGLMQHVLTVAGMAPSNCNAQPWVTHIVSGDSLKRIRALLIAEASAGRLDSDVPLTSQYLDQYRTRRIDAAKALFAATGVGRDDPEARQRSFMRNYELFDAPHAAFFFMPKVFGMREAADVGMYAQTLMLALTANGLASCAQGAISHYAGALRRELGVSEDLICLFGLSFGYPDEAHPSVAARTVRAGLDETVVFHD